ncbi:DUF1961 family protein [Arthrobacter livingstonensis]|uniref:DUF1961 family protein n=1 Tax=Arthrobacter livingstonensis TaxID=670078 RepID=UPI0034D3810D
MVGRGTGPRWSGSFAAASYPRARVPSRCPRHGPLPDAEDASGYYAVELLRDGPRVTFSINGLALLDWTDEGASGPPVRGGGRGCRYG